MKLLLDENLPKRLKQVLSEFEVFTVRDQGWNGKTNGELLKLMVEDKFDIFLTFDKNLRYQHHLDKYPIQVLILNAKDNSFDTLSRLAPKIKSVLQGGIGKGTIVIDE